MEGLGERRRTSRGDMQQPVAQRHGFGGRCQGRRAAGWFASSQEVNRGERAGQPGGSCLVSQSVYELAGSFPYGEQRRLEEQRRLARALGTNPGICCWMSLAVGANPVEKRELTQLIQRINVERDISVLLIEHDTKLVMSQ